LLEYISLNLKRPELCPSPFKLYEATGMPGLEEGEFFDGYVLTMKAEIQDIVGGTKYVTGKDGNLTAKVVKPFKFKAWVAGNEEIRVSCPLLSWSDRGNDDTFIKEQYDGDQPVIINALDVARNSYIKRAGVDSYETKEKIYVLRIEGTKETNIKLQGVVLEANKKAKNRQLQVPGLLHPVALNLTMDVSTITDTLEELTVDNKDYLVWKVSQVPRLVWLVANVAKQARRFGVMKEDISADADDDDLVKQMTKKVHSMSIGKTMGA
jgi:hypothetical protein